MAAYTCEFKLEDIGHEIELPAFLDRCKRAIDSRGSVDVVINGDTFRARNILDVKQGILFSYGMRVSRDMIVAENDSLSNFMGYYPRPRTEDDPYPISV